MTAVNDPNDPSLWHDFVYHDGIVLWLEGIIVRRYGYRPHDGRTARLVNNAWLALAQDRKFRSCKGGVRAYAYGIVQRVLKRNSRRWRRLVSLEDAGEALADKALRQTASAARSEAISTQVREAMESAPPAARGYADALISRLEKGKRARSGKRDALLRGVQEQLGTTRHQTDQARVQLAMSLRRHGLFSRRSA